MNIADVDTAALWTMNGRDDLEYRSFRDRSDREGRALFSKDQRHRYILGWEIDHRLPLCTWIMLNPSTATERTLDPTLRRCTKYALDWGYGGIVVLNAYAFRSTSPKACMAASDRVGKYNDDIIGRVLECSTMIVLGWGQNIEKGRAYDLRKMMDARGVKPKALRTIAGGHPSHPLYLPADLRPEEWPSTRST